MKEKEQILTIRHILVALDASPHSLMALAAAAELARAFQAKLIGLFVEDMNLVKLAQLPFAQQISYPKATAQRLDILLMEKQLQEQADRARQNLRVIAERDSLEWSFRVARGAVAAELLAAAMEADLLVLGRISRRLTRSSGLGSTARTAVMQARPPILLLGAAFDLSDPLLVFYDGSPIAQTALAIAATLAQISGYLRVLIWAADPAAEQHWNEITKCLANHELVVSFRRLSGSDDIADVVQRSGVGLFVIGDAGTHCIEETIQTVLEKTDHPILVVR